MRKNADERRQRVKASRLEYMRMKHPRPRSLWQRAWPIALLFVSICSAPSIAQAEIDVTKAGQIKAAYLRYIAEFTSWPSEALGEGAAPLVLGTLGTDPHGVIQILERAIEGKGLLAQKRRLILVRLPKPDSAEFEVALARCHLLFISGSEGGVAGWEKLRRLVADRPIVTIGELSGFSLAAGMIEFVIDPETNRVTMHIDLEAVQRAKLRLSSRLLGLKQGVKIVRAPDANNACATGPCAGMPRDLRFGKATSSLPTQRPTTRQDHSLVTNTMAGKN
jgi:hypothetical protein